ncbi:MAG TPA: YidC/Oxa1 family membrane protein insertase [Thermoleophilaceae bacterium]|nr:YidC/Oxa1 family membrane protein insertase [Thermoleophilaceae bacterium]
MIPVLANILQPLIDVADAILRFWHDTVGLGWGRSIVMLTVVVRIAILPLTYKGVRGMQNMQRLAPEMKKLQERYKDDKQRLNEEMMKFYQEHGFNPASSCLPLLLQIPFFISLFYLLRDDKFERDIRGEESFLFIDNLAEPETGLVLVVLMLLYVGTQLAASLVTAVSADRNQRLLVLVLPLIFVPILISFESGLIVYWITTNVWTFGQQLAVKKFLPAPEPLAVGDGDGKGSSGARTATAKPATAVADGDEGRNRRSLLAAVGASGGEENGGDVGDGARRAPPPSPRKKKKRSGRRR